MTDTLRLLTILAWSACAAGLAWYCLNTARQITYVALADGRQQERNLPLLFRPPMLCIFPAVLIILLGPILRQVMDQMF